MKSAYELAMERLGGTQELSAEQKAQLADIDSRYDAKKAQEEMTAEDALQGAQGDPDSQERIRKGHATELARIAEKREAEKNKIRNA